MTNWGLVHFSPVTQKWPAISEFEVVDARRLLADQRVFTVTLRGAVHCPTSQLKSSTTGIVPLIVADERFFAIVTRPRPPAMKPQPVAPVHTFSWLTSASSFELDEAFEVNGSARSTTEVIPSLPDIRPILMKRHRLRKT